VDVAFLHAWLSRLKGLTGQVPIVIMHSDGREEEQPPVWNIETKVIYTFGLVDGRLVDMSSASPSSTFDRFKAQVYNVLASQAARLRFCQNCGQLFVARKSQAYCTGKCSQAVRTRKYRTQNPEKFRRLRHAAYERRYPNAKIVSRRRVSPRRSEAEPIREELRNE
jgi:ribosomal protein S27AE